MGLGGVSAEAQALPLESAAATPVLDVPYLPQSILLCGGAAVAMVERWWGRRGVYAEDFSALLKPALGGIQTTDLVAAVSARGWDAHAGSAATAESVQAELRAGRPVVALIEVAPDRYHYVVVLGWSDGRVVYHDPARAPFTTIGEAEFLTRWTGADRWAMVIRPIPPAASADSAIRAPMPAPVDSMPCRPWLDQALDAAAESRLDDAARLLAEAGRACPGEATVLRELAGVQFKQRRHAEAMVTATKYLDLVPDDRHAWQLLATSRYLTGDGDGALEAWNRIGRPIVDLVRIDGIRRVRFQVIAGALGTPHGSLLTAPRLARARRRVAEIPALRHAVVGYESAPGGLAEVRATVGERPVLAPLWRVAATGAVRALAQSEVGLDVASPIGAGERWTGTWRWEPARPRAAVRLEMPANVGIPGTVVVDGAWERFRFAGSRGLDESRRAATLGFGSWVTGAIRPAAAVRLERWSADRRYVALTGGTELRGRDDRFTASLTGERAIALSADPSYTRAGVRARWTSALGLSQAAWTARIGGDWVSSPAPVGIWPVAGGNLAWAIPLRAHAPGRGELVSAASVGRSILHGGLAADHPVHRFGPLILAAGVFLDGARVASAADGSPRGHWYLDGGAGLRIGVGDGQRGVVRIDIARGLTDGRTGLTVGVHRTWPP